MVSYSRWIASLLGVGLLSLVGAQAVLSQNPSPRTDIVQPTASPGILGTWTSDWGPVTFEGSNEMITGFWIQDSNKTGMIKRGAFDPKTRTLVFAYFQAWNSQNGTAELTLSQDGKTLSGTWRQQSGSGTWTMKR